MSDIELDYDFLTQQALRSVIIDVLKITAELGAAPGEHHFYVEFLTEAPGVSIPDALKAEYPERMTIVLQHQFENLVVSDNGFSVTLSFKGVKSDLRIPFDSVTSFFDPSVEFGLRFEPAAAPTEKNAASQAPAPAAEETPSTDTETDEEDAAVDSEGQESADVVSLDAFRKK